MGDQPDGVMNVSVDHGLHCDGYHNHGTIIIDYIMQDSVRDGKRI